MENNEEDRSLAQGNQDNLVKWIKGNKVSRQPIMNVYIFIKNKKNKLYLQDRGFYPEKQLLWKSLRNYDKLSDEWAFLVSH